MNTEIGGDQATNNRKVLVERHPAVARKTQA